MLGRYYKSQKLLKIRRVKDNRMLLQPSDIERIYKLHKIVFYKNGIVVQRKARYPTNRHPPLERKGVYEMSQKSRLLLTHIVANCDVKFLSMFTLTYGDFFIPLDGSEFKRQINLFLTRFRKRYKPEYIWFIEFTKQQRPHCHVICNVTPNQWDRDWFGATWSEISVRNYWKRLLKDEEMSEIMRARPIDDWTLISEAKKVYNVHRNKKNWQEIYKEDGATRYCLKYATKEEQKLVPPSFQNVGRFWGTSHKVKPIPIGELIIGETQSESKVKEILKDTRIGQYALVPKYVFENDAVEYFTSRGLKLTEIFTKEGKHQKIKNPE